MFKNLALFIFATALVSMTLAHSQMRCAKYDIATGNCYAPIRNEAYSKLTEAYEISSGLPICQFPMSNPISASYSNGAGCPDWAPCPSPMGAYQQGENFTVMWFARNHAVPDQNPGTIVLYLSPVETENQGTDYLKTDYTAFCHAPYMSCQGSNGNEVQCYATCQMPSNAAVGIHTLWWKWDWQSAIYSTCADIVVTAASSNPMTPVPAPVTPTPAPVDPTPVTPAPAPVTPTPAPVDPTPVTPAPVTPTPAPVDPTPVQPAPVTPTPVDPTPVTPTPVTPTPVTPTPVKPVDSDACVLGNQLCVGDNQYKTCTNGRNSNYWAAPQTCRTGQTCHQTGLNVYCY